MRQLKERKDLKSGIEHGKLSYLKKIIQVGKV
jgi:hypothetical protein